MGNQLQNSLQFAKKMKRLDHFCPNPILDLPSRHDNSVTHTHTHTHTHTRTYAWTHIHIPTYTHTYFLRIQKDHKSFQMASLKYEVR